MPGHYIDDEETQVGVHEFDLSTDTGRLEAVEYAFAHAGQLKVILGKSLAELNTRAEIDAVLKIVNAMQLAEYDQNYARVGAVAQSVRSILNP